MQELERLREVGNSAAAALASESDWIHRRVESITFPFPERPIYRRHVSIDFSVPSGLKPVRDPSPGAVAAGDPVAAAPDAAARYYVPLSLIRRWPPLPRLDLRDSEGRPIPFLTGKQNAVLDAAALLALADHIVAPAALDAELRTQIVLIPSGTDSESEQALAAVLKATAKNDPHKALQQNRVFCGLAQALRLNTLLWLRVLARPGDREVVKFSYDMPVDEPVRPWSKPSFGLEPFVFDFETPHGGATGSYHCNVVAPPPLEVLRADVALYETPPDGSVPSDLTTHVRYVARSTKPRSQNADVDLFVGIADSQAKFYVSGDRNGHAGKLFVAVLIQAQGLLRGALGASGVAAAILALLTLRLDSAVEQVDAPVAVLLLTPIILGSILVRPSEHVLVGGYLVGVRRLVVAAGVVPVLAAASMASSGADADCWLYAGFAILTLAETATAVGFGLALRAGRRLRERFEAHPDASLS